MDGIVIKDCKDIKLVNNKINVDGTAVLVESSEDFFAEGNQIGTTGITLNANQLIELKELIANLTDTSNEAKSKASEVVDNLAGQNPTLTMNGIKKVLAFFTPIAQGTIIEGLKKILGM